MILYFDYENYLNLSDFVNSEENFFDSYLKYDILIINFDFLESLDYIKQSKYVIFVYHYIDEFIYKLALKKGDFCYLYDEKFKIYERLKYLKKKIINNGIFKYKNLIVNLNTKSIFKENKEIKVSKYQKEVLFYLIKNKNRFISKEEIEEVFNLSRDSIKVFISNLRKIGFDIETLKNQGYKIKEEK